MRNKSKIGVFCLREIGKKKGEKREWKQRSYSELYPLGVGFVKVVVGFLVVWVAGSEIDSASGTGA